MKCYLTSTHLLKHATNKKQDSKGWTVNSFIQFTPLCKKWAGLGHETPELRSVPTPALLIDAFHSKQAFLNVSLMLSNTCSLVRFRHQSYLVKWKNAWFQFWVCVGLVPWSTGQKSCMWPKTLSQPPSRSGLVAILCKTKQLLLACNTDVYDLHWSLVWAKWNLPLSISIRQQGEYQSVGIWRDQKETGMGVYLSLSCYLATCPDSR